MSWHSVARDDAGRSPEIVGVQSFGGPADEAKVYVGIECVKMGADALKHFSRKGKQASRGV